MTRSHKGPSRQERFTASVRAKAVNDGVHFGAVLPDAKAKVFSGKNTTAFDNSARRTHHNGRNGTGWNGGHFICQSQVEGDECSAKKEVEVVEGDDTIMDTMQQTREEDQSPRLASITVPILEMVRPAKAKTTSRKQFEFLVVSRHAAADAVKSEAEDEYDVISNFSASVLDGWEVLRPSEEEQAT